jgi:CTP synthase (UTP-ammonia lyase)
MIRIGLIGDYDGSILAHRAIAAALPRVAKELQVALAWDWLATSELAVAGAALLEPYDGLWCTPGSPYANTRAAMQAIGFARQSQRPYLGTCGGFQHALMEYAESLWQLPLAAHAEESPEVADPVIARLECSLVEVSESLQLAAGSRLAAIYGAERIVESYHCNYGLNPIYESRLATGPLSVSARDHAGQVRAVELAAHPFFVATLFQPERAALAQRTPPLVKAFVAACGSC